MARGLAQRQPSLPGWGPQARVTLMGTESRRKGPPFAFLFFIAIVHSTQQLKSSSVKYSGGTVIEFKK